MLQAILEHEATIVSSILTAIATVVAAVIAVRRPMKREHNSNAEKLGKIHGTLEGLVGQVSDTEHKIDDHIADHARGEFD